MDRQELLRRSWKGFQIIYYQSPRMSRPEECLLLSIEFDNELMVLQPLNPALKKDDFYANIEHCSVPPRKPTLSHIGGKRVTNERLVRKDEEDEFIDDAS